MRSRFSLGYMRLCDCLEIKRQEDPAKRGAGVNKDLERLCKIVRSFPLKEGENKTEIPFLSVYLSRERKIDMPRALSLPSMT